MKPDPTTRIALCGNPNCGKSSLFNVLTGLSQKISNIPGTTVERKKGRLSASPDIEIIDLPGIYSLYPKSRDEYVACEPLINREHNDHPDLVVIVLDASNMRRNLLLASQISDLGLPVVWCLNMNDVAQKKGISLDLEALKMLSGVPVIEINAREGTGIDALIPYLSGPRFTCHYQFYPNASGYADKVAAHYAQVINQSQGTPVERTQREEEITRRFEAIDQLLDKTEKKIPAGKLISDKLDQILVHKFWGILLFLLVLFVIFQSIFELASYPMDWIELSSTWIADILSTRLPVHWSSELLTNGLLPGITGILVFVPQIFLLFLFIGILEDTGYMARVSFMMDQLVRRFGLNGKSVVPLISGAACAIPAIMATRTIENWKERMITILVTPLISCSARLPVYILLISLFVPDKSVGWGIHLQGLALLGMYLLGFAASLFAAVVLKWIIRFEQKSFFIMELPVYHLPRWSSIALYSYGKSKSFVLEAGKIIVLVSMALWFLASYGPGSHYETIKEQYAHETNAERKQELQSAMLEASYAGHFGKWIEPAIAPLGFNWKIGIALITSFAAREVFVGTMSTIYSLGDDEPGERLREKMLQEKDPNSGQPVYTLAVALSLMVFYAFAMQCVSTLAVVKKETGSWKWPLMQLAYLSAMAYLGSWITYLLASSYLGV